MTTKPTNNTNPTSHRAANTSTALTIPQTLTEKAKVVTNALRTPHATSAAPPARENIGHVCTTKCHHHEFLTRNHSNTERRPHWLSHRTKQLHNAGTSAITSMDTIFWCTKVKQKRSFSAPPHSRCLFPCNCHRPYRPTENPLTLQQLKSIQNRKWKWPNAANAHILTTITSCNIQTSTTPRRAPYQHNGDWSIYQNFQKSLRGYTLPKSVIKTMNNNKRLNLRPPPRLKTQASSSFHQHIATRIHDFSVTSNCTTSKTTDVHRTIITSSWNEHRIRCLYGSENSDQQRTTQ